MSPEISENVLDLVAVDELGNLLGVEARIVTEYVELGLVSPLPGSSRHPLLSGRDVARLSRALRLARELELHSAAAALLVELLDERDALRRRVSCLERIAGADS
jgi:chaperone modulatory protein CbpM